MAAPPNTLDAFLAKFLTSAEIVKFKGHAQPAPAAGKILALDYPIKRVDEYFARACMFMNFMNYGGFDMIVANEVGAIVAALRAAGYSFQEIVGLRADETLDVINLIEGGQKLPQALHKRTKGADHKGMRLRDAIDKLLKVKVSGCENRLVTFLDLKNASSRFPFFITVLDLATAGVVALSAENFPGMAVADAVIASCAVQPYIAPIVYVGADGVKHEFYACGQAQSLPIQTAQQLFKAHKCSGNFSTLIAGYGYKGTDNEAASAHASGTSIQKVVMNLRAAPRFDESMRAGIILF